MITREGSEGQRGGVRMAKNANRRFDNNLGVWVDINAAHKETEEDEVIEIHPGLRAAPHGPTAAYCVHGQCWDKLTNSDPQARHRAMEAMLAKKREAKNDLPYLQVCQSTPCLPPPLRPAAPSSSVPSPPSSHTISFPPSFRPSIRPFIHPSNILLMHVFFLLPLSTLPLVECFSFTYSAMPLGARCVQNHMLPPNPDLRPYITSKQAGTSLHVPLRLLQARGRRVARP